MKIIGVDYSMSSPGICIFDGDDFNIDNCRFVFIPKKKSQHIVTDKVKAVDVSLKDFLTPEERYIFLKDMVLNECENVNHVGIEDYSYGSRGNTMLQIAENCSILKHYLHINKIDFIKIPPKTIKKFATKNGNANKEQMYYTFYEETKLDLHSLLETKDIKNMSPTSDIVDSYYVCKYVYYVDLEKNLIKIP